MMLYLQTERFTSPGTKMVELTVTSGTQTTTVPIKVYVRAPIQQQDFSRFTILMQALFLFALVALIVTTILIAKKQNNRTEENNKENSRENTKEKITEKKNEGKRSEERRKKNDLETYE